MINFDNFYLIPAIIFVLALLGVQIYERFIAKEKAEKPDFYFSNIGLLPSHSFSRNIFLDRFCFILRLFAILALIFALLRPQIGTTKEILPREGVAIHMLLDRSSSMSQKMIYKGRETTRLNVVKEVFKTFVLGDGKNLKGRSNDLIAISGFAFFSDDYAPLTLDHRTLAGFVDQIQIAEKFEDGTMIGNALQQTLLRMVSSETLLQTKNDDFKIKSKAVILLTDGEQTQGGIQPVEAAKFAVENNIKIYAITITQEEQSMFNSPFSSFFTFPTLSIDTSQLEKIAEITGGKFARVDSGEALQLFYQTIDELEKTEISESVISWKDYFPELIKLALILLCGEFILRNLILRKL